MKRKSKQNLKVGDKVVSLLKCNLGEEGIITKLSLWDAKDESELTPENHGTIEVKITKLAENSYLSVGEFEHYSYYKWQEDLKVIK